MPCDRCKADLVTKPLTLSGEERSTKKNLCVLCMDEARKLWWNFFKLQGEMPEMTDEDGMEFGKYKGEKLKDVPANYLIWIADQPWISKWPRLLRYINKNRVGLEEEIAENE